MRLLALLLLPAFLIAGEATLSYLHHFGLSSYTVRSDDEPNLKSRLDFPLNFDTLDISYKHNFRYFDITFSSSFLVTSKKKIGKDYDWKNEALTVYSKSKNRVQTYKNIEIKTYKKLNSNIGFILQYDFDFIKAKWYDTIQTDLVLDHITQLQGKTLKFSQTLHKFSLGVDYKKDINKQIILNVKALISYIDATIVDKHLLRGFYTIQNFTSLGYKTAIALKYKLTKRSQIGFGYSFAKCSKTYTKMYFYNTLDHNFASYPSSYKFKMNNLSIFYTLQL